jgi:outer membrane protein, heavy metal efflux system
LITNAEDFSCKLLIISENTMTSNMKRWCSLVVVTCYASLATFGQDSLRLNNSEAEQLFLQNNLSLLAARYNVKSQEALIQQAKTWDNPMLSTDQNLYDGKFFRHKSDGNPNDGSGQIYIALQQVIKTAGKRGLQVRLAEDNQASAEAQFNDLLRNLLYILHTDLNNLGQLQRMTGVYETEIVTAQKLVKGMEEMYKIGDISLKDNVRVKALLFSVQTDYADNLRQQQDIEKEIKTILGTSANISIISAVNKAYFNNITAPSLGIVLDSAKVSRPDIVLANTQVKLQQHNVDLQRALAVPDLTVGVEYDKASNYIPNYYGLSVSLPLPVFNKNRGNIVSAQWNVKQSQALVSQTQQHAEDEITAAFNKMVTLYNIEKNNNSTWQEDYEKLLQNVSESYKERKISLIEFIDFFDSYKDTKAKQEQQKTNLLNAIAEVNYTAGYKAIPLN